MPDSAPPVILLVFARSEDPRFEGLPRLPEEARLPRAVLALANRKALLILDGAEAADDLDAVLQVAGSCGVLITTRHRSDAPDDIQDLAPLPRAESLALLAAWAGPYAADDRAANEIVRLLGGLPLPLFLVGRYLSRRRQEAGEYAAWLQEQGLDALHFGDRPRQSVPLLLARSLEQVSAAARAAFGIAGILALAPFDAEPVAAALETTPPAAHRALSELVDYGLLLRPDGPYQVTHALAHTYARTADAPAAAAVNRLALYYAALAERESRKGLAGYAVLDGQRAHIVAVQSAALAAGQWDAVRRITYGARDYLDLKGYWTERVNVVQAGLDAARAAHDRYDEGAFLTDLGIAYKNLGEPRRAIELYEQRLVIAREIGDRRGEATASWNLGDEYEKQGELARAAGLMQVYVAYLQDLGHPDAAARAQRVDGLRQRAGL
jgi:tetratricopeptide (TPR) repeat protein